MVEASANVMKLKDINSSTVQSLALYKKSSHDLALRRASKSSHPPQLPKRLIDELQSKQTKRPYLREHVEVKIGGENIEHGCEQSFVSDL